MPQNRADENQNLWISKKLSISSCGLMGFYRVLCFYCSAPHTWQTVAHRLMRDRRRRQILNRLRHHKNEGAALDGA